MMNPSYHNVRLCYTYRDAGNYKQFGSVIFSNPNGLTIDKRTNAVKEKLISGEFFCPEKWNIPLIYAYAFDPELDHGWFEFDNFELTTDTANDKRTIDHSLKEIA
jgi:hypothetical protein